MLRNKDTDTQSSFFHRCVINSTMVIPLYRLADKINWNRFREKFSEHYCPDQGRTAKAIRRLFKGRLGGVHAR
jgi:hypothetical protein